MHDVEVRLHREVAAHIQVEVVPEGKEATIEEAPVGRWLLRQPRKQKPKRKFPKLDYKAEGAEDAFASSVWAGAFSAAPC